jgi:chromosome partitioning protein
MSGGGSFSGLVHKHGATEAPEMPPLVRPRSETVPDAQPGQQQQQQPDSRSAPTSPEADDHVNRPVPLQREAEDAATPAPVETPVRVDEPAQVADPAPAPAHKPELGPTGRPMPDLPDPRPVTEHGNARVIAMCNQKGGVGKTTTTINLGASLAEFGRKVLLVDFDPQGSLSVGLGLNPHDIELTVYNLLMDREVTLDDVVVPSGVAGMDLLPSNIDLSAAEVQLVHEVAREQTLARVLAPAIAQYDVILIDCQPSLGLLTVNALTASDGVIVPLECEYFALRGVALLKTTIDKVRERLNPKLEIDGVLGTMYDARTLHGREVMERLVQAWGDQVFHTVIRRTVKFSDSTVAGEPITSYASASPGADAYRQLAKEVALRCLDG